MPGGSARLRCVDLSLRTSMGVSAAIDGRGCHRFRPDPGRRRARGRRGWHTGPPVPGSATAGDFRTDRSPPGHGRAGGASCRVGRPNREFDTVRATTSCWSARRSGPPPLLGATATPPARPAARCRRCCSATATTRGCCSALVGDGDGATGRAVRCGARAARHLATPPAVPTPLARGQPCCSARRRRGAVRRAKLRRHHASCAGERAVLLGAAVALARPPCCALRERWIWERGIGGHGVARVREL